MPRYRRGAASHSRDRRLRGRSARRAWGTGPAQRWRREAPLRSPSRSMCVGSSREGYGAARTSPASPGGAAQAIRGRAESRRGTSGACPLCSLNAPRKSRGARGRFPRHQDDGEGTDSPHHLEPNGTRMSGRHLITSRSLRRLGVLAASAASLAFAAPVTAEAGTYELHQCVDPFGAASPIVAEWSASKGDIDNNCTIGGPLPCRLNNLALPNGETGSLLLDVQHLASLTRITAFRAAVTTNPTSGSNSYLQGRVGSDLLFHLPLPAAVSPTATYAGTPARTMSLSVVCNNTAAFSECNFEHGRPFSLTRLTLVLDDAAAPTATFSGTLVGTGPKAGTHSLVVTGNDPDSGVRDVELRIDGEGVDSASFAASCSPVRWQVCPANPSHTFTVDTMALADGSHTVSAVVTDHAGNTRTENWGDIVVRNSRVGGRDPIDDFDGDGQLNRDDADDDNDGVLDVADPDPFNA